MDTMWPLIWVTAISGMGGTGMGGIVACLFKKDSDKTVSLLLSFAAGVMTAVVCFDLLTEALNTGDRVHLWLVAIFVLIGYSVISLLNKFIDKIGGGQPGTAVEAEAILQSDHDKNSSSNDLLLAGVVMATAIALHNMPEGMVIGVSFAAAKEQILDSHGGLAMAAVIGLHNIPEGMAVAVPLISGGMKKWRAVLLTSLSGAPTIIGAVVGYLIGTISQAALIISLSFASGAMLYVVFAELLPESLEKWKSNKQPALAAVIGVLTGLIIVYL